MTQYIYLYTFVIALLGVVLTNFCTADRQIWLIEKDEFVNHRIDTFTLCQNAWIIIEAIERLGDYDDSRFGANDLLVQIQETGCTEVSWTADGIGPSTPLRDTKFVLGATQLAVVSSAKAILEYEPVSILNSGQDHTIENRDTDFCASVGVNNPDGLGLIVYVLTGPPANNTSLYQIYREKMLRCPSGIFDEGFSALQWPGPPLLELSR